MADTPADAGAPVVAAPPAPRGPKTHLQSDAAPRGVTAPVSFDYLAADRSAGRIYVPVGTTGSLDVYDVAGGKFTRVDGFKTEERERNGKEARLPDPSAVTLGAGVVYVGNRATREVCAIDAKTLKLGKCLKLASPTDGVFYVASAKEVWVTTPGDQSLTVLDASKPEALKAKTTIKFEGEPEGYAVDDAHGLVLHEPRGQGEHHGGRREDSQGASPTWNPACGSDGPRGGARVDSARQLLFVACTDHVQALDAPHTTARPSASSMAGRGRRQPRLHRRQGAPHRGRGQGRAGDLVARFDDKGQPTVVATGATAGGARNAVADANGNAYVVDPEGATLLVLTMP